MPRKLCNSYSHSDGHSSFHLSMVNRCNDLNNINVPDDDNKLFGYDYRWKQLYFFKISSCYVKSISNYYCKSYFTNMHWRLYYANGLRRRKLFMESLHN